MNEQPNSAVQELPVDMMGNFTNNMKIDIGDNVIFEVEQGQKCHIVKVIYFFTEKVFYVIEWGDIFMRIPIGAIDVPTGVSMTLDT